MNTRLTHANAVLKSVASVLLTVLLASCATSGPPVAAPKYQASVVRTKFGVPHVTARDWAGLGYGHGYVTAEDNLCVMAEAFLTFRGERSRYFGPKAAVQRPSTIGNPPNLDADSFFRHVLSDTAIARYRAAQPVEMEGLTTGYAAGYSRYVREVKAGSHPGRDAQCRDAEWVRAISATDLYRRMLGLVMATSSVPHLVQIANAHPPRGTSGPLRRLDEGRFASAPLPADLGSNMYGFGSDATDDGHGLLFGNPHWFWDGIDRFHQVHLRIPGKIDVQGASILGVPVVLIGFNKDVAWSHTVSTARRFTLYRLELVDGRPTAYHYDGEVREMKATPITIEVRNDDGTIGRVTRTLYESHYGPVLADGWTRGEAYTLRDVNAENTRAYRNWLRWNRAASLDEFMSIQREEVAIPWVNTIAVGRGGRVWYADIGAIPNVTDAKRAACAAGEKALDGSRSECEWDVDAASPQPGAFPSSKLPQLVRHDYAANMNDSFWLSNAAAPLRGFPSIIGKVDTEQSFRTRLGHLLAKQRLEGSDGLAGNRASSETVREMTLNSRSLTAELFLDDVLGSACRSPAAALARACKALAAWDRRGNLDSAGAQVWDEIWKALQKVPAAGRYTVPFDPASPIDTPRGLAVSDGRVMEAVEAGLAALEHTPVPVDARRRDYQYLLDAQGARIPLAGGCGSAGYFTILCASIGKDGPELGAYGNSYMQVVSFDGAGVEPYTLLVPSQSTDAASPHYRDYTRAYSEKIWLRAAFTEEEVVADTESRLELNE
jgi:acyl-homoserine-lactone acylase